MAGGGGVEDDVVDALRVHEFRHAFQHRRLVHAGGVARQVQVAADFGVHAFRHHCPHGLFNVGEVAFGGGGGVEFDDGKPGFEFGRSVGERHVPDVAEVVRRVGGHQQYAPAGFGEAYRGGGGDGCFANPAFAAEEHHGCGF